MKTKEEQAEAVRKYIQDNPKENDYLLQEIEKYILLGMIDQAKYKLKLDADKLESWRKVHDFMRSIGIDV